MPSLIDRATGKVVQVADDQAAAAVQSGKFGFQAGTRVPVVQQDGTIGTVASKDAAKALAQGLTLATTDQFKGAQFAAKYEGSPVAAAFQTVAAAGQGGFRSLSASTSDVAQIGLARALGDDIDANMVREGLRDQKAAHPWAEAAGQVGGFLLPMALTGGSSAIGAVPKGIMGAGRAAEAGVARMLGGGTAARIAGAATGAGTEAALMGVGHDISDAALENKPLTAEAMLAHGALNFATGAAIGGALKGGGEVLSRVLSRGGDVAAPGMSAKFAEMRDEAFLRSLGGTKQDAVRLAQQGGYGEAQIRRAQDLLAKKKLGIAPSREEMRDALQEIRGEEAQAIGKVIDGLDDKIAAAPKSPSTFARVADDAAELDVSGAIESPSLKGMYRGEKPMAERIGGIRTGKAPNAIDASLPTGSARSIDAALPENGAVNIPGTKLVEVPGVPAANSISAPTYAEMADQVESEVMKAFEGLGAKSFNKGPLKALRNLVEELREKGAEAATFRDMHTFRGALRDSVRNAAGDVSAVAQNKALDQAGKIIEKNIERRIGLIDPLELGAYKEAKANFSAVVDLAEMADKKVAWDSVNQQFGLGDKIMAGIGGGIGGIPGAIAGGVAGNVARNRGNQFAASMFGTLAKLTSAERATSRVTSEITQSVKGFFSAAPKASELGAQAVTQANVAKYMDSVAELNANPAAQAEKFAQAMGDLPKTAPELTQELAATNTRGLAFLASKIPPNRSGDGSLQPLAEKSALTAEQKRKWALYANTVNDPRSALKDLKQGRFTPEQAEALRVVYPQLYAVVQKAAMDELATQKSKLPLAKSAALGSILGVPGAAALTPARLQANQQVYQAPKQGRAPRAAKAPSVAKAFQTTSQRLESR